MVINFGTLNQKKREIWLEDTIKNIPAGSRILDAGAGELHYKKFCSHLEYVSQDFAQYDGAGDGKGLQTTNWDTSRIDIVSDITDIPEPDQSFDAIMCIEVFEHLPNPVLAIKEFSRLLRPGGYLIITAPFASLTHMAPYHYYSGFNRYFYEKHLPENGFTQIEISENGNYFDYLGQEFRRRVFPTAKHYSGRTSAFLLAVTIPLVLISLSVASVLDKGSQELLNYGFHVYARKSGER